jgi:hypothetical protein
VTAITRNILIDVLPRHGGHANLPIEDLAEIMPAGDQTPELSAGVNQPERNSASSSFKDMVASLLC